MKIFTYAFNNPTYLDYQNRALRKFVKEPFEFYCIDNASQQHFSDQLKQVCNNNNIHHLKNPKTDHSEAGRSHQAALQWSWDDIISKTEDLVVMMDHDAFPIDYVSMVELLGDAFLAGPAQSRGSTEHPIEYFHPSLMIFNTQKLPNKDTINFYGPVLEENISTDTGGNLYFYFKNNPEIKKKFLRAGHLHHKDKFFSSELINKYGQANFEVLVGTLFEMIENKFLHVRNGSDWDKSMIKTRPQFALDLINSKLDQQ